MAARMQGGAGRAMESIEVVKVSELVPGVSTPGITRDKAFEGDGLLMSRSRIEPKAVSAWHHHGQRTLVGYLVAGELHVEYGPGGSLSARLEAGDHFRIPPGIVHRDVNPDHRIAAVVVAVLLGTGPTTVEMSGPDPA